LKGYGYKNSYACFIPEWLIVSECVDKLVVGDKDAADYTAGRAKYGMTMLLKYAEALATVRAANIRDLKTYEYGM
jgi:hypothetical protein